MQAIGHRGCECGIVDVLAALVHLDRVAERLAQAGDEGFVRTLRISLTIAIVSSMFLSEQYFLPFWLIGGLAAAIWVDGQRREAEQG